MGVEWDPGKAASNARKHGVDFADVVIALEDPNAITTKDPDAVEEERYISMGMDPYGRILVTAFTFRNRNIRIISSRKASKQERRRYEELK
ncbi:MAG: BrnT family toxin [Woeseiaceae bacterium]|nr:BrnT family toxin [Woeseiaceae bacterium]